MFGLDDKKKEVKEGLLEKLIEQMLDTPDKEESCDSSDITEALGEEKPKAKVEVMELEVKPKAKYKLADGTEQDDESLEEILERKKKEKLEV